MTVLQRVHGEENVANTLRDANAAAFDYNANPVGLGFAGAISIALLGTAYYFGRSASYDEMTNVIASVVAIGGGLFFGLRALYWYSYAKERFLAVSEEHLFVGKKDELWQVSWSIVDADAMGFSEMQLSKLNGSLTLSVAKETIPIHLFNAFAYLDRLEEFMFHVLNNIAANDEALEEE